MATLALVFVVLVVVCRGQWFFGDEWAFILYRGLHNPRRGLLYPHNEHWVTLPILWFRAVFSVFGLKAYWPYLFGLFATHLVAVHAAWRLMRRARVGAPLATGLALVFGLFGAGSENLLWAFQVTFVGSLAAGLVLVLLVDERGDPGRVAVVASGAAASLLVSGISVVMVGALGLAAFGRWGWRKALAVTAPAAALYVIWLLTAGRVGLTSTNSNRGGPRDIPRFVWGGMSTTLGAPFRNDRVGEVLVVVLVVVVAARARSWWTRAPELVALAAAAPVMFVAISQGRGGALGGPAASRYVYVAAGLLLPLIGFGVAQLVRGRAHRVALALVACVGLAVAGAIQLGNAAHAERGRERALRSQILTSMTLATSERTISNHPDFKYNAEITVAEIVGLRERGRLRALGQPTATDLAYARLALQLAVTRGPAPIDASAAAQFPSGSSVERRGDCFAVDLRGLNAVITRTGDEARFSLMSSTKGIARVFVPYAGGNAGPREIELTAGVPRMIRSVLVEPLVLQLPPGVTVICGISWGSRGG